MPPSATTPDPVAASTPAAVLNERLPLAWFFDFHSHRRVRIGHRPDAAGVAATLANADVEEVTTFAKGHCGYSYYPTDLPTCYRHPQMVGDPFGDIVEAAKRHDLRAMAYISFGIDGEGVRQNPHWRRQPPTPSPISSDSFNHTCPYTPYVRDSVLPQIKELTDRYPIDGFFFDTMGALSCCYCDDCRRAFQADKAMSIPRADDDAGWDVYGQWRHDRALRLLDEITTFIHQCHPDAIVGFNQLGTLPFPEPLPAGCNRLTLDFATRGHQSRQASRCGAFGATSGRSADIMPTIFNGGWGDWSPAPPQRHEQLAVSVWSRGSTIVFGDRLHPDNRLAEPTAKAVRDVHTLRQTVAPWAPPAKARIAPDVLLLHATSTQYGPDHRHFALDPQDRLAPLNGAGDLLLDAGENYAIVAEHRLEAWLSAGSLAVVAEVEALRPEAAQALHTFVNRGGQVLFVGRVPHVNGEPLDWTGVRVVEQSWHDHVYLPGDGVDDEHEGYPVLVRGDCFRFEAGSAEVLDQVIEPVDVKHGERFGWGIAPPQEHASTSPLLTRASVGSAGGAAWTLAAPLMSDYQRLGDWRQVAYLRTLMRRILPRPNLRVESPHGQIEAVLRRGDQTDWVWLVHHGGEYLAEGNWPRTWGPPPTLDVEVHLQGRGGRQPQRVTAGPHDLPWQRGDNGDLRIAVRMGTYWRIIRIDWT